MTILILLVPLLLMWFFLIRPQQRRAKERNEMVARLDVGDEIATAGGILGVVSELAPDGDDEVVLVEVAEGMELAVLRRGIGEVRFKADDELDEDGPAELPAAESDGPIVDNPIDD